MDIVTLINNHETVLLEDACEDKKVNKIINQINRNLTEIVNLTNEFQGFTESQLQGDYNKKLVMAKSLLCRYGDWPPMVKAYEKVEKEERIKVDKYYNLKQKILDDLRTLLKISAKSPVVSQYHISNGDFIKCSYGHEEVILGSHNTEILRTMVDILDIQLQLKGRFEEIESKDLLVNYANVMANVNLCNQKLEEMYTNNASKYNHLKESIAKMEDIGKVVVLFTTYRDDLKLVGVSDKDLDAYEKDMTKNYIPYKKELKKAFNIEFAEICDIVVNEDLFATAGENGYTPDFTTYNSSEVTFINSTPNAQANNPDMNNQQSPQPNAQVVTENEQHNVPTENEYVATQTEQVAESEYVEDDYVENVNTSQEQEQQPEVSAEKQANANRIKSRFGKIFDAINNNSEEN